MSEQMTLIEPQADVLLLRDRLGAGWPFITAARERAEVEAVRLHHGVRSLIPPDTSLVVFGSLARGEFTEGSDVDWTLLVDGSADPEHQSYAQRIGARLRALKYEKPNAAGPFGRLTFSHDLIHRIGGDDDTNHNTTQRLLLLLESMPIGQRQAHDQVLHGVLDRYVSEDLVAPGDSAYRVPRFLQNDVARYWRTMAVDYAHKRRARGAGGWALRSAKLRMSRKLLYAAGLVNCFSCALDIPQEQRRPAYYGTADVVRHLRERVRIKPLDRLAQVVLNYFGELSGAGAVLFGAYDEFLSLLSDDGMRRHLNELRASMADEDEAYQRVREIGTRFQDGLTEMFLEAPTPLRDLTLRYGVF